MEDANGCLYPGLQDIVNVGVLTQSNGAGFWSLQSTDCGWRIFGAPREGDCMEVYSLTGELVCRGRLFSSGPIEFESGFPPHGVIRIVGLDGTLRFSSSY